MKKTKNLVVRLVNVGTAGKGNNERLTGIVYEHPDFADGSEIATSPIVKWERETFPRWGETAEGTRYDIVNWNGMTWKKIDEYLLTLEQSKTDRNKFSF